MSAVSRAFVKYALATPWQSRQPRDVAELRVISAIGTSSPAALREVRRRQRRADEAERIVVEEEAATLMRAEASAASTVSRIGGVRAPPAERARPQLLADAGRDVALPAELAYGSEWPSSSSDWPGVTRARREVAEREARLAELAVPARATLGGTVIGELSEAAQQRARLAERGGRERVSAAFSR